MKKYIVSFIVALSVILMTACGTDSKENAVNPSGDGTYSFFNATTPIVITQTGGASSSSCSSGTCPTKRKETTCSSGTCSDSKKTADTNSSATEQVTIISVQLLKFGLVEPGEIVEMKPFDRKYGFLTNSLAVTDINGRANFVYNLPEDFNAIRGQNITIQAIYTEKEEGANVSSPYEDKPKNVLLTQDFVLQFR
jgi:hypothetical protein